MDNTLIPDTFYRSPYLLYNLREMLQRGVATFTLDYGRCPRWLFERMVKLSRAMVRVIVFEEGPDEFIKRIADPVWFQSLGTVLAFDWNASGLTTILTAALKEAIRGEEKDLGIFICGGKGKTSRKTPDEIAEWGSKLNLAPVSTKGLIYNSKMAAKVDSALIHDNYQIYHHSFFFTLRRSSGQAPQVGSWTVVQQGMNTINQTARRYHWHSNSVKDLINEPHSGIASDARLKNVLNMTAGESAQNRKIGRELVSQNFNTLMKDIKLLRKYFTPFSQMVELTSGAQKLKLLNLEDIEFKQHPVVSEDFSKSRYLEKILAKLCEEKPENYEKLLSTRGVGPKTIRALALVAELIYGARPSYEDPARYSFAHGGKDSTPYPIDRPTYDQTIEAMKKYVEKAAFDQLEKRKIINKLNLESGVALRHLAEVERPLN